MGICRVILLIVSVVAVPAAVLGDSTAYVVAGSITPGCLSSLNLTQGTLGSPVFVPASSGNITVDPRSKEVWDLSTDGGTIWILDPKTGITLSTIALPGSGSHPPVFGPNGGEAYILGPTSAAGPDGILKVDVASRKIVQTLPSSISSLAISVDGSELFTVSSTSNVVYVLNASSLATVGTIAVQGSGLGTILVSGQTLLIPSNGEQLNYLDVETLQQTNTLFLPANGLPFAVSPDGTKIYVKIIQFHSELDILDFSSGQVLVSQTLPNIEDAFQALLSPGGTQLVVGSNPLLVLDPTTLATIATQTPLGPNTAAFVDEDDVLTIYPNASAIMLIDQDTAQLVDTFPLGMYLTSGEVPSSTGGVIFVGSTIGNLIAFNTSQNRTVAAFPTPDNFILSGLGDGQLYGANGPQVEVDAYNLKTRGLNQLPPAFKNGNGYYQYSAGAVRPNGSTYWAPFLFVGENLSQPVAAGIGVYSTATNEEVGGFQLPFLSVIPSVVFSPDSSLAYVSEPSTVAVYNAETLQQVSTISVPEFFQSLAISPDGSVVYGNTSTAIFAIDTVTGAQSQLAAVNGNGAFTVSPDGTTLFVPDPRSNVVNLVNTASGLATSVAVPYSPTDVVAIQ